MSYLTTEKTSIFTSSKKQTVILELWNEDPCEPGKEAEYTGPEVTISCDGEFYNKKDVLGAASPNTNPDIVHFISMNEGSSIMGACGKDGVLKYNIIEGETAQEYYLRNNPPAV